jgi:hypothetical protein
VVLHAGQVVEQGTHDELLACEDGLYRYYHSLQFQWDEEHSPVIEKEPELPVPDEDGWTDLAVPFLPPSSPSPRLQGEHRLGLPRA